MPIEVNSASVVCTRCGTPYGRRKGYFPVSYAVLHKGIGYIPVCKDCIESLYSGYLSQCNNAKDAVRQVCRKLDLYWSDNVYGIVERKNTTRSMMTSYIAKINTVTYAGKCYDDTLLEDGTLWNWVSDPDTDGVTRQQAPRVTDDADEENADEPEIDDDVVAFWGPGYTASMYADLEQRRAYWLSRFPDDATIDIGTEALIRQVCNLEIDINRDRAAGKSIDKNVNALNTILGSMSLKPTQQKAADADAAVDNTPFGVWIKRWENQRPIPDADPELQDVDGIVRYLSIWFLGHLCKMLGIRNTYCKLYEDELAKMRVERPEYEDEDDETMFNDIFGTDSDGVS